MKKTSSALSLEPCQEPFVLLSDFKLRQRASVSAEAYGHLTLSIRLLANDLRCTLHLNWLIYFNRCSAALLLINFSDILMLLLSVPSEALGIRRNLLIHQSTQRPRTVREEKTLVKA